MARHGFALYFRQTWTRRRPAKMHYHDLALRVRAKSVPLNYTGSVWHAPATIVETHRHV